MSRSVISRQPVRHSSQSDGGSSVVRREVSSLRVGPWADVAIQRAVSTAQRIPETMHLDCFARARNDASGGA